MTDFLQKTKSNLGANDSLAALGSKAPAPFGPQGANNFRSGPAGAAKFDGSGRKVYAQSNPFLPESEEEKQRRYLSSIEYLAGDTVADTTARWNKLGGKIESSLGQDEVGKASSQDVSAKRLLSPPVPHVFDS